MSDEKREVAFVTGAASGIGRAIALRLARRGDAVGLFDLDQAAAQRTAEAIGAQGGTALALQGDVTDETSVATAVSAAVDHFGGLDTVVARAGIMVPGTVLDLSLEEWQRTLAVDLTGAFLTAKHTIPHLVRRGGGAFVAIGSDAGLGGWQGWAAYSAAKHGLIGLARCLALDHGRQGVRSNCVCPCNVETVGMREWLASLTAEEQEGYTSSIPLGRFAKPEEVAEIVAHLSSMEASFTNGLVYALDGGETAGHYRA